MKSAAFLGPLFLLLAPHAALHATDASPTKPNIIVFLVDDMGLMDTSVPMLVDENGKFSGEIQGIKTDNRHFNRSGYTTLAHRYVDLILDRPAFKADPVQMVTAAGRPLSFGLTRRSIRRSEISASSEIAMPRKSMARATGWP